MVPAYPPLWGAGHGPSFFTALQASFNNFYARNRSSVYEVLNQEFSQCIFFRHSSDDARAIRALLLHARLHLSAEDVGVMARFFTASNMTRTSKNCLQPLADESRLH